MKGKRNRKKWIGHLFILAGILLPLIPLTRIAYSQWNRENRFAQFQAQVEENRVVVNRDEVERYNEATRPEAERRPVDPFFDERYESEYAVDVELTDDVFAYLSLPSIDLMLPVYLGSTSYHLSKGAAHVDGTALPVGGVDRRTVIAGHFGWSGDVMFLNLGEMKPGDPVIIKNADETLLYRVSDVEVIGGEDFEKLMPIEGRDMVTLITCWPGPTFPDRLLVNCERMYENETIAGDFEDPASLKVERLEEPAIPDVEEIEIPRRVRLVQWGAYGLTLIGWVYFAVSVLRFVRFLVKE